MAGWITGPAANENPGYICFDLSIITWFTYVIPALVFKSLFFTCCIEFHVFLYLIASIISAAFSRPVYVPIQPTKRVRADYLNED